MVHQLVLAFFIIMVNLRLKCTSSFALPR